MIGSHVHMSPIKKYHEVGLGKQFENIEQCKALKATDKENKWLSFRQGACFTTFMLEHQPLLFLLTGRLVPPGMGAETTQDRKGGEAGEKKGRKERKVRQGSKGR